MKVEDETERDPLLDIDAEMILPFPELRVKRDALKERLADTPEEREMSVLLSVRLPDEDEGASVMLDKVNAPAVTVNRGVVRTLLELICIAK